MAQRLAHGGISDDSLDAARNPLLAEMSERTRTDDWWAGYLAGSSRIKAKLDEMVHLQGLIAAVTPSEVRKAAADWLARAPMIVVALPGAADQSAASSLH